MSQFNSSLAPAIERLREIARRSDPPARFNKRSVEKRLLDVLITTGFIVIAQDQNKLFQEFAFLKAHRRKTFLSYRELGELASTLIKNVRHHDITSNVNALSRGRRHPFGAYGPSLSSKGAKLAPRHTELLIDVLQTFVAVTEQLTIRFEPKPPRGPKPKTQQDLALVLLADFFAEWIGCHDALELSHAPASAFICFAHDVLRPHLPQTEGSHTALANRWKRYKRRAFPIS